MKLYIPFNMIIDTDVGIIRLVERLYDLSEYPINSLKSFLLRRASTPCGFKIITLLSSSLLK